MITKTHEKAAAKINLFLDVLGKREDGYHDIRSVLCTTTLCDDVFVSLCDDSKISVLSDIFIPGKPEDNLAYKAALAFFKFAEIEPRGVLIDITKRIPMQAGLGGGSADAAAVLRALNRLYDNKLSTETLLKASSSLGSDVPFCLLGGCCLAEGRGEILTRLPDLPDYPVLICMPSFTCSTAELYSKFDVSDSLLQCNLLNGGLILDSIHEGDFHTAFSLVYNDFESVLPADCIDTVSAIKTALTERGALGACLSGSGSAVFGIFDDEKKAADAENNVRKICKEVFSARISKRA